MSMFTRIIRPLPITRRAYSSFFSSKPGGGRYFNSTKPPKTVVSTGKSNAETANPASDGVAVNGSGSPHNGSGGSKMKTTGGEEIRTSSSVTNTAPTRDRPPQASHNAPAKSTSTPPLLSISSSNPEQYVFPSHPAMSPEDYKLHQFFSLHRPLLLHAQPASAIFESPLQPPRLFTPPPSEGEVLQRPAHLGTIDDPPEASPEADADAARQLARALVINRVGGAISWEDTLMKLGLDEHSEEGRAAQAKEWAREWETVYADSVKRKRRKKMKKHKLKKRRRAQRSQKLKLN